MLACFGSDRRAQVSGVLGNFRKVQPSEGSHLAQDLLKQALDSPLLAEWDNPEPSKDICDSVGQGLLQEKLRVLGSVWGDLTQICLGSAIATALEQ